MENAIWLIPAFFVTALTYASVGFGGGSTYLALMVLAGLSYKILPPLALVCNLIVVTGGLYHYIRNSHLRLGRLLPFVVASLPFAYLGGKTNIAEELFLSLLGLSLAVAGVRLFLGEQAVAPEPSRKPLVSAAPAATLMRPPGGKAFRYIAVRLKNAKGMVPSKPRLFAAFLARWSAWGAPPPPLMLPRGFRDGSGIRGPFALLVGAVIGFLSGIVGIGGGIFLAPILYFFRWGNGREIAAAASFFIFVNSIAGLAGQFQKIGGVEYAGELLVFWPLAVAVFVGGQIGSRLSVGVFSLSTLQRATAVLILMVSGRIFWGLL